jgi:hypothetical protein
MRDKRERFVDLAEKRVSKAIQTIRLISNLANKNNYEYSEDESNRVIAALEAEVRHLKSRFAAEAAKRRQLFKL